MRQTTTEHTPATWQQAGTHHATCRLTRHTPGNSQAGTTHTTHTRQHADRHKGRRKDINNKQSTSRKGGGQRNRRTIHTNKDNTTSNAQRQKQHKHSRPKTKQRAIRIAMALSQRHTLVKGFKFENMSGQVWKGRTKKCKVLKQSFKQFHQHPFTLRSRFVHASLAARSRFVHASFAKPYVCSVWWTNPFTLRSRFVWLRSRFVHASFANMFCKVLQKFCNVLQSVARLCKCC